MWYYYSDLICGTPIVLEMMSNLNKSDLTSDMMLIRVGVIITVLVTLTNT